MKKAAIALLFSAMALPCFGQQASDTLSVVLNIPHFTSLPYDKLTPSQQARYAEARSWTAFRGAEPISEAQYYRLLGHDDLSHRAARYQRRNRIGMVLGAVVLGAGLGALSYRDEIQRWNNEKALAALGVVAGSSGLCFVLFGSRHTQQQTTMATAVGAR